MKLLSFITILLMLSVTGSAQKNKNSIEVTPGVSLELATWRARMISNIQYTINLDVPEKSDEQISGFEKIDFTLKEVPENLQLDFKQNQESVKSVTVNGNELSPKLVQEHLIISGKTLKTGQNSVEITFNAGSGALNRNEDYMYALFVPDRARTAFPCFDQPDLKAKFLLRLTIPKDWKALANAKLQSQTDYGKKHTYQFDNSDLLPSYLFSFCAGKFTALAQVLKNRNMELLHRETDEKKLNMSLDSVFNIHDEALDFLENWTGISYPFQKIGFAAIPDFQFGGMEHPGAVFYKSSSLFLNEGSTKDQFISRKNLISHETAHMWFGDLVTMKWFNDVWMKEVFANFMADKVTQKLMGHETFELKFLQDHFPAAYAVDRTLGANPIRQELKNLNDAGSMYGNIIYHKAPIMMRQLESLMGEENFHQGIKTYLNTYANKNATWNDLISILANNTDKDLHSWNDVWVNKSGRPIFSFDVKYKGNEIWKFVLKQDAEDGAKRQWPQQFEMKLIYPEGEKTVKINVKRGKFELMDAKGLKKPLFYLFNSDGRGYGLFPLDNQMLNDEVKLTSPIERASLYINVYENSLSGRSINPQEALNFFTKAITKEENEMNLRVISGYISNLFWGFITPEQRTGLSSNLEQVLWQSMEKNEVPNNKKIIFNTFQNVFMSKSAFNKVSAVWQKQLPPKNIKLNEDDYSGIALSLAVRCNEPTNYLTQQIERTTNPDRKKRLNFLLPALSSVEKERDLFFESLKDRKNRTKEAWVTAALSYLHHPLRQQTSNKYLKQSLELLEEIQVTGDIFFPLGWVSSTFGSYQTAEAYQIVSDFLKQNPKYNPLIKNKILQGTDNLRRAVYLMK